VANVEAKSRVGGRLCGWVLSCIQGHAALGSPTVAAPSKRRMPAPAPEPAPAPAPVPSAEATAAAAVEAQIGTTLQRMVSEGPPLARRLDTECFRPMLQAIQMDVLTRTVVALEGRLSSVESAPVVANRRL